jgi:protein TonB
MNPRLHRFVALPLLAAAAILLLSACSGEPEKPRKVASVKLLPDTPPPPPPPPKPEDKPPPPKPDDKREVRPDPKPADTAQQQLKSDEAAGSGPGSGLAAGSVSQDYQGGPVIAGSGGGGAAAQVAGRMAANAWAQGTTRSLNEWLQREADLKRADYRLQVHLWLNADGRIARSELLGSSGDAQIDTALRAALERFPGATTPPPSGLPQPLRLQLSSRQLS